jgi:methyl-accepting chemotaxis protein
MEKNRYDRKWQNYLINKNIQLRLVLTNLVYMVVIIVITLAVLLSPLFQSMFFSEDLNVQYQAAQTFLTLLKRLIPAIVVLFTLVFIHQILITHRICGPLVNFDHTFRRIMQGDFTRRVHLRRGDYWNEECDQINAMLDSLSQFIINVRSSHEKLMVVLEDVLKGVEDLDTRQKISEALDIVKHEALQVKEYLSVFRTDGNKDA